MALKREKRFFTPRSRKVLRVQANGTRNLDSMFLKRYF